MDAWERLLAAVDAVSKAGAFANQNKIKSLTRAIETISMIMLVLAAAGVAAAEPMEPDDQPETASAAAQHAADAPLSQADSAQPRSAGLEDDQPSDTSAGLAAFDTRRSDPAAGWIMGYDPEYYTLQIISLSSEKSVRRFLESIAVRGRVKGYVGYDVAGTTRYGAFIGIYSSYADAKYARERLPPHIQEYKPWIRKVKDVRQRALP